MSAACDRNHFWAGLFLLLAPLAGCSEHGGAGHDEAGAEGEKTEAHVTVKTVPVKLSVVTESVEALGRCEALPDHIATLTPAVEGHVHELTVVQGTEVKKGQPIVVLDQAAARADLAEKTATRDGLKASLALLQSIPRKEERRANELAVEQAKVAVERARYVVDSLESLRDDKLASKQQLFDARKALETAEAQRDAAEATLKVMMIGPRPEAVAEAEGRIKTADALVAFSQAHLEYHTIRAPIDGVLDSLTCHPGQTIAIGTPIGEIVDTRQVFATVWLPTRKAIEVKIGQAAVVRPADTSEPVTDGEGHENGGMTGKVAFVGRVADAQTGNLPIRILVDNSEGRLSVGQSVSAAIAVGASKEALQVPSAAIVDLGEGPILNVVREGKSVAIHPELGETHHGWVVISKAELKPGEPVIVEGGYNLPEGTSVSEGGEEEGHDEKAETKEKGEKPAAPENHEEKADHVKAVEPKEAAR